MKSRSMSGKEQVVIVPFFMLMFFTAVVYFVADSYSVYALNEQPKIGTNQATNKQLNQAANKQSNQAANKQSNQAANTRADREGNSSAETVKKNFAIRVLGIDGVVLKAQGVSVTLLGGDKSLSLKHSGVNFEAKDVPIKPENKYVILVESVDAGGQMSKTVRFTDPYNNQSPIVLDVPLKPGLTVINRDGTEVNYPNDGLGPVPPLPAGSPKGGDGENGGKAGNRENTQSFGFLAWVIKDIIGISVLTLALTISGLLVWLFFKNKALADNARNLKQSLLKLEITTDNLPENILQKLKKIIENIQPREGDVESSSGQGKVPEPPTPSDVFPTPVAPPAHLSKTRGDENAVERYHRLLRREQVPCITLMPISESSPRHMVEKPQIKLKETPGGTYLAFIDDTDENRAWVFPTVGIAFDNDTFHFVFPELKADDYLSGNIKPKSASLENTFPARIWRIDQP